jgi:hypothetical protein
MMQEVFHLKGALQGHLAQCSIKHGNSFQSSQLVIQLLL